MISAPTISVVTVCLNSRAEIESLTASVLPALGEKDEWVIQDGGSSDGTVEFVNELGDRRVKLVSHSDTGIYDAMNKAAMRSSGDYLVFLGSDDKLRIKLDDVRTYLVCPQAVYYGDVWRTISRDRYAGEFNAKKLARTNICQQAIFYPKAVFEGRRFDEKYAQQADWVFNMDCFADSSLKFEHLDILVADYAQGGASSLRMDEAFQRDYRKLLRKYFSFRQRWKPSLLSALSYIYRALPGVSSPQQTPARNL